MPADQSINQHVPAVSAHPATSPWGGLSRKEQFYSDDAIGALIQRAESYVAAGSCLHLCGPAGLGKTTLALRVAETLGRPVAFMAGNQWLEASDFVGREVGQSSRTVVDKYIQSVRRTDAEVRADWRDSILATAMRKGYTLVYDEFTRASPQANAVLLSVLEEGILVKTDRASKGSYVEAHPDFRMIMTSNPHDYVGINGAPDALLDRMVTLQLPPLSAEALTGIVGLRTGLDPVTSRRIVDAVCDIHQQEHSGQGSPLRAAMMVSRIAAHMIRQGPCDTTMLTQIICDVLGGRGWQVDHMRVSESLATPVKKGNP